MSQYAFRLSPIRPDTAPVPIDPAGTPEAGTTTVRLGWDPPLDTFFAIVQTEGQKPDTQDPVTHLWLGVRARQIPSIDDLTARLARWVVLPDTLLKELIADQIAGR